MNALLPQRRRQPHEAVLPLTEAQRAMIETIDVARPPTGVEILPDIGGLRRVAGEVTPGIGAFVLPMGLLPLYPHGVPLFDSEPFGGKDHCEDWLSVQTIQNGQLQAPIWHQQAMRDACALLKTTRFASLAKQVVTLSGQALLTGGIIEVRNQVRLEKRNRLDEAQKPMTDFHVDQIEDEKKKKQTKLLANDKPFVRGLTQLTLGGTLVPDLAGAAEARFDFPKSGTMNTNIHVADLLDAGVQVSQTMPRDMLLVRSLELAALGPLGYHAVHEMPARSNLLRVSIITDFILG